MAKRITKKLARNAKVTDYRIDVTKGKARVTIDYNSKSNTFSILNPIGGTEFGFKRPVKQLSPYKQDSIALWKDVVAAIAESVVIIEDLICSEKFVVEL